MKKLLSILAAVGLTATTGATVVACGPESSKETKGDFDIKLEKDTQIYKAVQGVIEIDKYSELKEKLKDFKLVLPEEGDGKDVVKQIGDFDAENGKFIIEGIKEGTVNVQVKATEIPSPEAEGDPVEKISGTLTIKVTVAGLEIVKIEDSKNEVADNTAVTEQEAKDIAEKVKGEIEAAVGAKIKDAKNDTDYTIDTSEITAGDMSTKGVEATVSAKEGSSLIKEGTKATVKVLFENIDTRGDLGEVVIEEIKNDVLNNASLTEDEVNNAQAKVKSEVETAIRTQLGNEEIALDTDYEMDLTGIAIGVDLSAGLDITVKALADSDKIKEGTETPAFKVSFQNIDTRGDLGQTTFPEINHEVLDITNVTQEEVDAVKTKVLEEVESILAVSIPGATVDKDYRVDAEAFVIGDWSESKEIKISAIAGSEFIKEGTEGKIIVTLQNIQE